MDEINKIYKFKLKGKFAHFRKFYTNSSSLTYFLPPRTVISGLFASILNIKRNNYYDLFSSENCGLSVGISEGCNFRKTTQSMNYLHKDYYGLIAKGNKGGKVQHSQCKLELLLSVPDSMIEYNIFLGAKKNRSEYERIVEKIKNNNLGYGIYFGQRQFKAEIEYVDCYSDIDYFKESNFVNTVCSEEDVDELDTGREYDIIKDRMPVHFKKITKSGKDGREPLRTKMYIYDRNGKILRGKFKNCYITGEEIVNFM